MGGQASSVSLVLVPPRDEAGTQAVPGPAPHLLPLALLGRQRVQDA